MFSFPRTFFFSHILYSFHWYIWSCWRYQWQVFTFSSVTQVVLSTVTFFSVFPLLSEVFLIYQVMSCLLLIFKNRVPKSWLEALCTWLRFLYYRVIWLGHFIVGSSGVSFSRSLLEWKLQLITDLFLEPNNNAWHTWSVFRAESSCLLPGAAVERYRGDS